MGMFAKAPLSSQVDKNANILCQLKVQDKNFIIKKYVCFFYIFAEIIIML